MNIFLVLMLKHFIVDIGIQMHTPSAPKNFYFSGHRHYLEHGVGAFIACIFVVPVQFAVAIAVIDYVLHWHTDWSKWHLNKFIGAETRTSKWWWIMVLDQCVHTLCYYGIAVYFSALLAV